MSEIKGPAVARTRLAMRVAGSNLRLASFGLIGVLLGLAAMAFFALPQRTEPPQSAAEVAQTFFVAGYIHDYSTAWELISRGDKQAKNQTQYLSEHPPATALQAELLQRLADWGTFTALATTSTRADQSIVSTQLRYPDRTQPAIATLLEAAADPNADASELRAQLQVLFAAGQVQFTEEETAFNLTKDRDGWRVVLHWGDLITIHLDAAVSDDLAWDFYPSEVKLTVRPGETIQTAYFVRNRAAQAVTGKAIHEVLPLEHRSYLETIQCFCFTEQTLAPGEEREMPLIIRVDFTVPQAVTELTTSYTFYPLASFPDQEMGAKQ